MIRVAILASSHYEERDITNQIEFEKLNLCYVGSRNGVAEGAEFCNSVSADIVIVTMNLIGGNAIDLVSRLQESSRHMEIIVVTEGQKFTEARELMRLNVTDILLKPICGDELDEALRRAIRQIMESDNLDNLCRLVDVRDVKNDNFVAQAITYLERHYKEKLSLQSVADKLFVSSWHLCKLFKKYTGKSFIDILNLIRISKAREFLKTSALKVNEIARYVGYNDIAYFTVLFRKMCGMTPLKYRSRCDQPIAMNCDGLRNCVAENPTASGVKAHPNTGVNDENRR